MIQKIINFQINKEAKQKIKSPCKDMGLFYSESNMKYLKKITADIDEGRANLVEHDLIEID